MTQNEKRLAALEEIKRRFEAEGVNVAEWARERGFLPLSVYDILNGRTVGRRGEAHRIAVLLGLKDGGRKGGDSCGL